MTLKPGVAYCFRAFYSMISDMVEGSWSHFVRRLNADLLGTTTDLRTFLFGSGRAPAGGRSPEAGRAALARYRPILEDVQEGRCLYCERGLGGSVEVDHFIPWRRYPTDLGHDFVLAHGGCNARKGDRLAAEESLVLDPSSPRRCPQQNPPCPVVPLTFLVVLSETVCSRVP